MAYINIIFWYMLPQDNNSSVTKMNKNIIIFIAVLPIN